MSREIIYHEEHEAHEDKYYIFFILHVLHELHGKKFKWKQFVFRVSCLRFSRLG